MDVYMQVFLAAAEIRNFDMDLFYVPVIGNKSGYVDRLRCRENLLIGERGQGNDGTFPIRSFLVIF